jgi:hypothetical protein
MKPQANLALSALAACMAFLSLGNANAQDIQGSVITVSEMLKIDNAQALQRAQEEAVKSGILQGKQGSAKVEVPLPVWTVRSIYGVPNNNVADLQMDANVTVAAKVGQTVEMCEIEAINSPCVELKPKSKKTRKGSCPAQVCWTGNEISAELSQQQTKPTDGIRLLPSPLPTPPLPLPSSGAPK